MTTPTDRARFEAVYRAQYPTVLRFLQRRSDRATADELAAETFAIAWRKLDAIPAHAAPWLLATARNLLANDRRNAAHRADKQARAAVADAAPDTADLVGERDLVRIAFARLDESDRETLALIAWDGLSQTEAAQVLGISRLAFAARASRARRRLAAILTDLETVPAAPYPRRLTHEL